MISRKSLNILTLFVALVALRLPYFLTQHVQEDAYIGFRTAFNLADHGDYSFNLGERMPGSTSSFYPLVVALLRLMFGDHALVALQFVNTGLVVAACYLVAAALVDSDRMRLVLWTVIAMLPVSLFVSYYGMETALLLFALALVFYGLSSGQAIAPTLAGMFLLPLIRPDAVGFGMIFVAAFALLNRKSAALAFAAMFTGVVTVLLFNFALTGDWLTETAVAKEITYHPDRSVGAVLARVYDIFVVNSFLTPISTKFLTPIAPLCTVLLAAAGTAAIWLVHDRRTRLVVVLAALSGAVAVPVAYAYGGVIMEWYLVPSAWLAYVIAAFAIVEGLSRVRRTVAAPLAMVCVAALLLLDAIRYAVSLNVGTQEADYRAAIGKYLATIAAPGDTLLLEPAGYIPFYAGLRTYDEIGLISRPVTEYRQRYGTEWWIHFVEDKQPTYLVQRAEILAYQTLDGYQLSPAEIDWFRAHYDLVERFHYDPAAYATNAIKRKILQFGSHSDYLLYRARDVPGAVAQPQREG